MKNIIIKLIAKELKLEIPEIEKLIEIPVREEMGDFAFPCFSLAKKQKKSPIKIAEDLTIKFSKKLPLELSDVNFKGGYVNFFINKSSLAKNTLSQILSEKEKFGKRKNTKKSKKIMIEFPSPNTNKPLHLGHLRNMAIGESVARILEFSGNKIIRTNLNNDRGVHICKSMLAYQKWGKGKTPKKKSDHFVGDFYVLFNEKSKENSSLEKEVQEMLKKWEQGNSEIIKLWKKMNNWALKGFEETFKLFGIKHDKEYFESEIYKFGKEIILEGLKKGIFEKKDDGAIIINLEKEKLGEKVLLRSDGTSIYITQDIYLAKLKNEEFNINGSIYIVGNEQDYHFKVLFAILKKLGLKFADNLNHLSYGMVELPEGKMKSREGTVVDADDLILETQKLVKKDLIQRYSLSKKEIEVKSLKITLAAIKYNLLKVDIWRNMVFNPKESIKFEGDTGSYLLYSYARASSILRKTNLSKDYNIPKIINITEIKLIKKLANFPEMIVDTANKMNPSILAHYCYEISKSFSEFYHNCPVIGYQEESFRLNIIKAFRIVMKNALYLLGIDVLEEM